MQSYTEKWQENFNRELPHIQIAFDAFFVDGKLEDYYTLRISEDAELLILSLSEHQTLPKQIEDALIDAFNQSKP
ncbi:hypothetical protein [Emticicia sp. TH156]|uniref:hypothetical protein n=1 Tax=Emticicia sp. TH156 TaxID=2067454 RepID=UPI000C7646C2|nr:hypothetical protein [Emticicia sp. TH156]PLK44887.1 hypothetical protein C0V77_06460 [Emticicia sp. TH156]